MNQIKGLDRVIVATSNQGKLAEYKALLAPFGMEVLSNHDVNSKDIPVVVEDGETFEANALKKAQAYYERFNIPAIGDDSGLQVDVLKGAPGVYSARYAGPNSTDTENYHKLLEELKGVPFEKRKAKFVCTIALIESPETKYVATGSCEGYISEKPVGEHGFGYDPVFFVPEHGCSMAELTKEEKNRISHRFHALRILLEQLQGSTKRSTIETN